MIEFIQHGIAIIIVVIMFWVLWETTKMVDEKKQRQRKGLTDYYDNPIKRKDHE